MCNIHNSEWNMADKNSNLINRATNLHSGFFRIADDQFDVRCNIQNGK